MLSRNHPDRIQITFDDRRLVAKPGCSFRLARHLGLLYSQERLDLGDAPGRANAGDKNDAGGLGATALTTPMCCAGLHPAARSRRHPPWVCFRWGHVRPGGIDLDSTICETYGLAKEGARHHGYHPLLAIAAGTGDVLMSRLREGRANTARGAAHFLRETVSRVRRAGASGQLSAGRAASRPPVVRWMSGAAEPVSADSLQTGCRWMDGAAEWGNDHLHPLPVSPAPHRCGSGRPDWVSRPRPWNWRPTTADRDRGHSRPQVRRRSEPHAVRPLRRQRRLAGGTGDGPQPLDGADRSGRADRDHQDPSATVLLPGRTAHPLGTPPHPASATALALGNPSRALARLRGYRPDGPPKRSSSVDRGVGRRPATRSHRLP